MPDPGTPHPAVHITGMSGAGKSTVLASLAVRGIRVIETDDSGWVSVVAGEPLWRLDRIAALLDETRDRPLVVQGTVANQNRLRDRFDAVVLLTAPTDVLMARIRSRTGNDFGKAPDELARVLTDIREVEPLLRATATQIVDTSGDLGSVVDEVARIIRDVSA